MFLRRDDFQEHQQWLARIQAEEAAHEQRGRRSLWGVQRARQSRPAIIRQAAAPERGVFEAKRPLRGYRSYTIVNSQGETIRQCTVAERHATPEAVEAMWRWLDQVDPAVQLRAV